MGDETQKKSWEYIIIEVRLPQAITAMLTGAALAVSGLLLQTVFQNPLADPGILGISTGASLGVAFVLMLFGGVAGVIFSLSASITLVLGAFLGATLVLLIIMGFSSIVKNNVILLIIGIMISYLASSLISLLKFWSTKEQVFSFVLWGMGDFSGVSLAQLPFYASIILIGILASVLLIKPLNALLLGERYAKNLGVNVKRVRFLLLFCAGLLTAVTTAFCGPISFIGLAVPHIARLTLGTSNHYVLLPITLLLGAGIALLCNIISILPGSSGMIPLNAITPLFGAPIIIYVILNQRKIQYFN